MKIYLIKPYAFCPGVQNTINKTLSIIKNNRKSHIYLIGNLIHNQEVCDQLNNFKNVKVLDDKSKTRLDLVKSIKTKNNILIFSAHGTDPKAITFAKQKHDKVYDLTCPFVAKILNTIKVKIKQGYFIAYYGTKNHPEAIAAKAVGGKNLLVYKTKQDIKPILMKKKVCVVCQTTMDYLTYVNTKVWFNKIKNLEFINMVCQSSKMRQTMALLCNKYDLIFVLSDKKSHNGLELFNVLKRSNKNTILIEPNNFVIDKKLLKNKKDCAIYSSSSVSLPQVINFVNALKKLI